MPGRRHNGMVTYDEYFRDVLGQILDSRRRLESLQDGPGDLETVRREAARVAALFRSVASRAGESKSPRPAHRELAAVAERYAETYSFEHEIGTIAELYSGDAGRIRNIRLKVLESLEDGGLANRIKYIIEDLG